MDEHSEKTAEQALTSDLVMWAIWTNLLAGTVRLETKFAQKLRAEIAEWPVNIGPELVQTFGKIPCNFTPDCVAWSFTKIKESPPCKETNQESYFIKNIQIKAF